MSIYVVIIVKNFLPILLYGISASNLDEAIEYTRQRIFIFFDIKCILQTRKFSELFLGLLCGLI